MTDYTPTAEDIEDAWCSRYDGEHSWSSGEERRGYEAEFNRWLNAIKAEAWDEGHDAGWASRHEDALIGWVPSDPHESDARNPYRKANR